MRDDQASGLRRLFARRTQRLVGVGGRDATPIVCDLAHALAELGDRVLVIDRTRGGAPARMQQRARWELAHVVAGDRALGDVLIDAGEGVAILPAARGLDELALGASPERGGWKGQLAAWCANAHRDFDVWLINGLPPDGAGAEVLVTVDPSARGITSAYAQIKALACSRGQRTFGVVVHGAESDAIAQAACASLASTVRRFLGADVDFRGAIPGEAKPRAARRRALIHLAQRLVAVTTAG
jgi:flagellar biosynthesis protein FlhG